MALSNRLSCLAYDNKHHKISYFVDEKNHKDVMYVEFDNLKFDFTKVLGKGRFGITKLFTHQSSGNRFVVKTPLHRKYLLNSPIINLSNKINFANAFKNELGLMEYAYPNAGTYSLSIDWQTLSINNQHHEAGTYYLQEPYFEGETLHSTFEKVSTTKELLQIILALVIELQRIQDQQIYHRDLKEDNILVHKNPQTNQITIHYIDFNNGYRGTNRRILTYPLDQFAAGSHLAPELFAFMERYIDHDKSHDVYSLANAILKTSSALRRLIKTTDNHCSPLNVALPASIHTILQDTQNTISSKRPNLTTIQNTLTHALANNIDAPENNAMLDYCFSTIAPDYKLEYIQHNSKKYVATEKIAHTEAMKYQVLSFEDEDILVTFHKGIINSAAERNFRLSKLAYPNQHSPVHTAFSIKSLEHTAFGADYFSVEPFFPGKPFDLILNEISTHHEFLQIILAITKELQRIHAANIIHGNISDKYILVHKDNQTNEIKVRFTMFKMGYLLSNDFATKTALKRAKARGCPPERTADSGLLPQPAVDQDVYAWGFLLNLKCINRELCNSDIVNDFTELATRFDPRDRCTLQSLITAIEKKLAEPQASVSRSSSSAISTTQEPLFIKSQAIYDDEKDSDAYGCFRFFCKRRTKVSRQDIALEPQLIRASLLKNSHNI